MMSVRLEWLAALPPFACGVLAQCGGAVAGGPAGT